MALYGSQGLEKGHHRIWEVNLQPLEVGANVAAFVNILTSNILHFISYLGPNNKPKMLKVGPKCFWP
jgi:hypothetical protein